MQLANRCVPWKFVVGAENVDLQEQRFRKLSTCRRFVGRAGNYRPSTVLLRVHLIYDLNHSLKNKEKNLYIYIYMVYTHSNEIHNVVALIKCLLILRCQLYMFRTVTVHPQELLCRHCMCRLWYVVRNALSDTSRWYKV